MNAPLTLALLLTAYTAVFLQCWLQGTRALLGITPNLLPALIVCASLRTGVPGVALVSVAAGLWLDALSANPFGVSVLPLAVVGLVLHAHRSNVVHTDPRIQALLGLIASAVVPVLTLFLLFGIGTDPLTGPWFAWRWIASAFVGAAVTPLLLRWFDWIQRAFAYRPEPNTSFRSDRQIAHARDRHVHR